MKEQKWKDKNAKFLTGETSCSKNHTCQKACFCVVVLFRLKETCENIS